MSGVSEFTELIAKQARQLIPKQTIWAICKQVDWHSKTMTATGQIDDLDYQDILLGNGFEFKKPKVGSLCLLGILQNNEAMTYLIDAVEIEEHLLIVDKTVFKMDLNGFLMQRENSNLKSILLDLIKEVNLLNKELQKVVVSVGVTPNVPVLQQIEQRTANINTNINELFS